MKHTGKRIYQKKKQRKFKHTKHPNQTATSVIKPQADQKDTISTKPKAPTFQFAWFKKLLHLRVTIPHKEKEPKNAKESSSKRAVSHWLKQHDSDVQLILFPLILLVILITLSVFNNKIFLTLSKQSPIIE